jgi:hypothetical protein
MEDPESCLPTFFPLDFLACCSLIDNVDSEGMGKSQSKKFFKFDQNKIANVIQKPSLFIISNTF